ncbi:hypothetical protein [Micromonospora sp. RTGN7]|uniref:hypothetical protein n=1 Tax=Micromonospora sp. RTGN7 TaxID=3016526 RepID=UPI0029FF4290|nr:hypothetical protein [Micromonospora sp. RTGN7]
MALPAVVLSAGAWLLADRSGATFVPALTDNKTPSTTATVERRNLVSVLASNGSVVSSPSYSLTAPKSGVYLRDRSKKGVVPAGTVIGWIRSSGKRVPVTNPVEATVQDELASSGTTVPQGLPLVSLKASGYGIRATISEALIYRLSDLAPEATAQVDHGPGPFPCRVLGGPDQGGGEEGSAVSVTCAPPADLRLFPGLKGVLAVRTGEARDVLALPVEAVAGSAERGRVRVQDANGSTRTRDVKLGMTDGSYIQIVDGLAVGDVVVSPAPALTDPGEG